jgi:4-diphosphocytidyl-2-C-methyl-D-erythritol kinase
MNPWRSLAPAKINLGLFVGPPRADGRHELVSVMQSISLADELILESASQSGPDEISCPAAPSLERGNLAMLALEAFRTATGWDPGPLRLTLDKRVPIAAGMGGGSGDAAAALRLAAAASGIEDERRLLGIAADLGADVPAQVTPGRWLALGAGERLQALPAPRDPFGVLVLPLDAALSTAAVYAEADRLGHHRMAEELAAKAQGLHQALAHGEQLPPPELLANDLQAPAVSLCPQIGRALAEAADAGADVTLLSGSGPTVLGLYAGKDGPDRAIQAVKALATRQPPALAATPVNADFARARPVRNNDDTTRPDRAPHRRTP